MVKTDLFHEIAGCRICRARDFVPVIDLGRQTLSGRFPAATEPDPPSAPLVVVRCTRCGLVQLRYSVDTGELFTENYGYRYSDRRDHAQSPGGDYDTNRGTRQTQERRRRARHRLQ